MPNKINPSRKTEDEFSEVQKQEHDREMVIYPPRRGHKVESGKPQERRMDPISTLSTNARKQAILNYQQQISSGKSHKPFRLTLFSLIGLLALITVLSIQQSEATVLMRVCDTREIKTVTNRVCMLYKRTKNSDLKQDKGGNLRLSRDTKGEYSPAKLATYCCKVGCPPHIFAHNCD